MSSNKTSDQMSHNQSNILEYQVKLKILEEQCQNIIEEKEFKELFKGIILMFLDEVNRVFKKLLKKIPDLKYSDSSKKIDNLNILVNYINGTTSMLGIDINDIIIRGYTTYFYLKFRDDMINWNIDEIKKINESDIEKEILETASKENIKEDVTEHLNLIPEIFMIVKNLELKNILKLFYILKNMNTLIDVYLLKKNMNEFA